MKVDTFFQNFELLTDAPNAVVKLREIILQLAVMGKLVSHNSDDEDAQTLIKRIKAEKKKLIEAKKLRKEEDLSSVRDEDKVYQLPQNWIWCRWNDIALCIGDVDHKMPAETKEGIPYVSPKDFIEGNTIDFARAKKISQEDFETLRKKIQPLRGDIIFPRYGTIGENRLVETDIDFLASYSCAVVKNFHSFIEPKYSFYYSLSNLVKKEIERYTNKTTQANVGVKSIKNFIFPLPPLAEQKRIVEKCDRLLSTCDEIEKRQQQKQESIVRMNESAIAQLLSSKNPDEFRQHWQHICNNFDLLYSIPETIPKLRQAILQLAVEGKLTRQNPNDEPASVLLSKINFEKENLVQQGKIKTDKPIPIDKSFELLNKLPQNWQWVRLKDFCIIITDGDHLAPPQTEIGIPLLVIGNVRNGFLDFTNTRFVPEEYFTRLDVICVPKKGDILYTLVGSYGIPVLVNTDKPFCVQRHISIIKPSQFLNVEYLKYLLSSEMVFKQATECATGIAQKTVPLSGLRKMIVPLPPLAEQKRIVEKCDRLMSLCDTLEAKLKQGRDSSEKLMEVAAKQVLTA